MRAFLIFIFLSCLSFASYSQQTDTTISINSEDDEGVIVKPDDSDPLKIGIKIGTGYCSLLGSELQHPAGRVGVDGSVYLRYRFKSKLVLTGELGASFRGSNFNNGIDEYSSIRMYYLDVPAYLSYPVGKTKSTLLIAGLQYSYLLNANIYIYTNGLPNATPPALKTDDILPLTGVQFNTDYVAFQILLKYGLLNINSGLLGPDTKPAYKGGDIHNFAFEINFLF